MRTRATIQVEGRDSPHQEEMDLPANADPVEFWQGILENFNNTLRTGEKPRTLLSADLIEEGARKHVWVKTNLVTISGRKSLYDELKCEGCGVTARGYGVPWRIELDPKFRRARVYQRCDHTVTRLEKLADAKRNS